MFFSLILLRYRGNPICRTARAILDKNNIVYTEIYIGDEDIARAEGENICRLYVNGTCHPIIPRVSSLVSFLSASTMEVPIFLNL